MDRAAAANSKLLAALRPTRDLGAHRKYLRAASLAQLQALHCLALPPPPRFHDHALTFVLRVTARGTVLWPDAVEWVAPPGLTARTRRSLVAQSSCPSFPATFVHGLPGRM